MTIAGIRAANAAAGGHFFEPATERFFRSRTLPTVYEGAGGIFFVTSEQPPHGKRAYTVRRFNPATRAISTVGEHCKLSRRVAVQLAQQASDVGPARAVND